MRQYLVAGNWKMHGNFMTVGTLLRQLLAWAVSDSVHLAVFPTSVHLPLAIEQLKTSGISVGAQTCSQFAQGAYTGEVAADMLSDLGCQYVLVGHSERRQYFGETDAVVAAKLEAALGNSLVPILCVGETLEAREAGQMAEVVTGQLQAILDLEDGPAKLAKSVIAYEPIWAIGTGVSATSQQAQEAHALIRDYLSKVDEQLAQNIQILYGGSVKAANAPELFAEPDIDGVLVGGASLDGEQFLSIAASAQESVSA